jgi:hypothetical protein
MNNIDVEDLVKLSRWLMGYVMELHDFRNGILKVNYETIDRDKIMHYVKGKFPQLQGIGQQLLFRELGINPKDNQDAIKRAIKHIKEINI